MKKQILILVLALFAITYSSSVFGQDVLTGAADCPTVNALSNCGTTDPLNPQAGILYNYSVTVEPVSSDPDFHWFVTTDPNFITASAITANREIGNGTGPHILAAGTGYNDPATGLANINMTWKYWVHDPDAPVFLVIYAEATAGCLNDNIQAYVIIPQHSFTLDIQSIAVDGSESTIGQCVDDIASAVWSAGTIQMDYGTNYLFFTVTAANFNDSWLPSFQVTTSGSRTVTAVEYNTPAGAQTDAGWVGSTLTGSTYTATAPVDVNAVVGNEGNCIVVRVTVANNQNVTEVAENVSLAVNGIMWDGTGYTDPDYADLDHATCQPVAFEDIATQSIEPRPVITDTTPPAGDNFVPKNDQP